MPRRGTDRQIFSIANCSSMYCRNLCARHSYKNLPCDSVQHNLVGAADSSFGSVLYSKGIPASRNSLFSNLSCHGMLQSAGIPPKGRDAEKRCRLGRVVSNQEKGRSIKEFLMQSHDVSVSLAHAGMPSDIFRPGASVGWNTVDRRRSFFPDAGGQPQRLSRHKKRIRQLLII